MSEWKEYKLKDISINNKGNYGIPASAVEYSEDKYTYLRISDINDDGSLNKGNLKSVEDKNASNYLLAPNDIVFARTGNSTGRSYFYNKKDGKLVYAGFLIKFSIDETKINPKILKYYTHSQPYFDWVRAVDNGATRGNINAQTYGEMEISLPPRLIQDTIVSILSSLDDKINLLHRQNQTLEQMAETLFRQWFVEEADDSWEEGTLGDIVQPKRGKNITRKDVIEGIYPVIAGGLQPSCYHNKYNTTAPVITISASGANAGYVAIHYTPVWSSDSSYIDDGITKNIFFIYNFLKINQKHLFDKQEGSAQPHIYPNHIMDLPLLKYPTHLIDKYERSVTSYFNKINKNKAQIKTLEKLRDTLLPKLMNGEVRVKM